MCWSYELEQNGETDGGHESGDTAQNDAVVSAGSTLKLTDVEILVGNLYRARPLPGSERR